MKRLLGLVATLFVWSATLKGAPAEDEPLKAARQLLVVESKSWDAAQGRLRRFERTSGAGPFHPVGEPLPVFLGRAGLSLPKGECPLGIHCEPSWPQKAEGDGRSPAGIFPLGELWGYAPRPPAGVRLVYHQSDASTRCVDDPGSPLYNQIVAAPVGTAGMASTASTASTEPWRSAERLLLPTEHYKYVLFIDYNTRPARPFAGSCIFLHVAPPPGGPTDGCTALFEKDLMTVLRWLDPKQHPLLVQLPSSVLAAAGKSLNLPSKLWR